MCSLAFSPFCFSALAIAGLREAKPFAACNVDRFGYVLCKGVLSRAWLAAFDFFTGVTVRCYLSWRLPQACTSFMRHFVERMSSAYAVQCLFMGWLAIPIVL